jgi:hypothetical protein
MNPDVTAGAAQCANQFIGSLGDLLKWGLPGLALAIIIVSFVSLHFLQKAALAGTVPPERIAPFERLQKSYLFGSLAIFCVSAIVSPVIEHFFQPQATEHTIAFSLAPMTFDREDLAPRLVIAGPGKLISFNNGTGEDRVSATKSYLFNVDKLVKEINDLRAISTQFHAAAGGHDDSNR